ncbi:MAG: peptidylprolyl isomerase [Candidatus Hydrogenedentes bacterium]|nr:peptidylprolyl isomerase [Candidatus Hydrogenedentota bacterium]
MTTLRAAVLLGLLVFVPAFAGYAQRATTVDQVVATVDKEAILLSDIMAEIGPQLNEIRRGATSDAEFDAALQKKIKATLDQAIENKVLLREAQNIGLKVEEDIVEKRLDEYKKLFSTNEEFMKELQSTGETLSDLRNRLRKQMLARTMAIRKTKEFDTSVTVTESEVAQYYQDHMDEFKHPERVHAYQIFLPANSEPETRAKVKAHLEELRSEIDAGSDFEELANQYSKAPGSEDGGLIGWVERGDLVHQLEDTVFGLKPGQLSEIVETDGGFHLLMVDKREEAGLAPLAEVRKDIEPILRTAAAGVHYKKWIEDLKRRSSIQVFI